MILRQLLFSPKARFSELNKTGLTSDQFTFHLNKLIRDGLVEKQADGYRLTTTGMEIAGRVDIKTVKILKQPKLSVMVFVEREGGDKKEVLVSERLTDPVKGKVSLPVTKVIMGESLVAAAKRCLYQETGLSAEEARFAGVFQYQHYKDGVPQEVAVIVCFRMKKISGNLREKTSKARNWWQLVNSLKDLNNVYDGFNEVMSLLLSGRSFLREVEVRE